MAQPKKSKSADIQSFSWTDWKRVFNKLPERFSDHHVLIVAGGVAFYFFLSVFPALAAIISIYGMLTDASALEQQMSEIARVLPDEAQEIITERLRDLVEDSQQALGWQLALSTLISIWITNVGTRALFRGVNIAYDVDERRKSMREIGLTLIFTIGGIIFYILALILLLAYPAMAGELSFGPVIDQLLQWFQYPLMGAVLVAALILVYRYAPVDQLPRYRRVAWGAGIATLLWVIGSWILGFGVKQVGVAPSYGPLAAVAILMLWFLLSSFVILIGAEINSELEQQAQNKKKREY